MNFEAWARERVGVTVEDVVAEYRKEGLLLSDEPNEDNCWEIRDRATWGGDEPPLKPEVVARRARMREEFLATWDGSIGMVIYPDGREVRMHGFEGDCSRVRLMAEDLRPGEPAVVDTDVLFSAGCHFEMTLGFALKSCPT